MEDLWWQHNAAVVNSSLFIRHAQTRLKLGEVSTLHVTNYSSFGGRTRSDDSIRAQLWEFYLNRTPITTPKVAETVKMSAQEGPPSDLPTESVEDVRPVANEEEVKLEQDQTPAPVEESSTPAPTPSNPNRISKTEHKIIYDIIARLTAVKDEEYAPT